VSRDFFIFQGFVFAVSAAKGQERTIMTNLQKTQIMERRASGEKYSAIAAALGLSENTIKSFCRRSLVAANTETAAAHCPQCGAALTHLLHKREKKFCADVCRLAWWNALPEAVSRKAVCDYICAACGKPFTAYGDVSRKFCSRVCYGLSRRAAR
jgi:endogenous inhibitor of DNA gyrase (YacG/DUF329 family)